MRGQTPNVFGHVCEGKREKRVRDRFQDLVGS